MKTLYVRCPVCDRRFDLVDQLPPEGGLYWDRLIAWLRQHDGHTDKLQVGVEG